MSEVEKNYIGIKLNEEENQQDDYRKLNYNYRDIGVRLIHTNQFQSMAALIKLAQTYLKVLKKCAASQLYHPEQVENAIVHAQKMLQCVRTKEFNLKNEEQELQKEQDNLIKKQSQKRENENKAKKSTPSKKEDVAVMFQREIQSKRQRFLMLERKCRIHRNEELEMIMAANKEYSMKQKENQSEVDVEAYMASSSAVLELDGQLICMDEKQLELLLEQELGLTTEAIMQEETVPDTGIVVDELVEGDNENMPPDRKVNVDVIVDDEHEGTYLLNRDGEEIPDLSLREEESQGGSVVDIRVDDDNEGSILMVVDEDDVHAPKTMITQVTEETKLSVHESQPATEEGQATVSTGLLDVWIDEKKDVDAFINSKWLDVSL